MTMATKKKPSAEAQVRQLNRLLADCERRVSRAYAARDQINLELHAEQEANADLRARLDRAETRVDQLTAALAALGKIGFTQLLAAIDAHDKGGTADSSQ